MARQRIEMSRNVFARVFSSAVTLDKDFPIDSEVRWITRWDDGDADLMANAKVQVRRLGQREVTAVVDHKDRRIFCASGRGDRMNLGKGLRRLMSHQAYFLCLLRRLTSRPLQLRLRLGAYWKVYTVGSPDTTATHFCRFLRCSLN